MIPGEVLSIEINWQYAILGLTIGCCGGKAVVCLLDQARETRRKSSRKILEFAAGLTLGGVSFWGAGVILMAAMRLSDKNGNITQLQLNMAWVVYALLVSLVSGLLTVICGTRDSYFGVSKIDRVEMLEASLRKQKIAQLRTKGKAMIMQKALLSRVQYVIGAGVCIGIGAEACDLILKISLYRDYALNYNSFGLFFSLLFAGVTSIVAGWMLFRLNQWKETWESLRVLSTLYLGTLQFAIFIVNTFTMTLRAESGMVVLKNQLSNLTAKVACVTVCLVMVTLSYAIYDMRLNINSFRSQADEHYKQLRALHDDVPLNECHLQPGSVYLKSSNHSEMVKLELILMNIETYLARFTTVRDSWTEEFYRDPAFPIAAIFEDFHAKEKLIAAAQVAVQQGRRSSITPIISAINLIHQGKHLIQHTSGASADGQGAEPATRRNSLLGGFSPFAGAGGNAASSSPRASPTVTPVGGTEKRRSLAFNNPQQVSPSPEPSPRGDVPSGGGNSNARTVGGGTKSTTKRVYQDVDLEDPMEEEQLT